MSCVSEWFWLRVLHDIVFFFFFSSRRRHTRCLSDWSSDVCSSDLIEPTRIYRIEDAREFLSSSGIDVDAIAAQVDEKFMSAFVRAVKPNRAEEACCGPACCR